MITSNQIISGIRTSVLLTVVSVNNKAVSEPNNVTPIGIIIEPVLTPTGELINSSATTQAIISSKLTRELAACAHVVAENFPYENYPGKTVGDIKEGFRSFVKEAIVYTNCIRLKAIANRAEQRDEITNNASYEQDIKNLALWIGENFRDEIVDSSKRIKSCPSIDLALRNDDGRIVTVAISNEFTEAAGLAPQMVDVFVNRVSSDPDGEVRAVIHSLNSVIGTFARKVGIHWSLAAESASTNYETRKVYAQQLVDLEDLHNLLASTDTTVSIKNTVCLPWHQRSLSSTEYAAMVGNTRKVLQRTTDKTLHTLFDAFQQYRGTRHLQGVMY